jgi:hypothetical protein
MGCDEVEPGFLGDSLLDAVSVRFGLTSVLLSLNSSDLSLNMLIYEVSLFLSLIMVLLLLLLLSLK